MNRPDEIAALADVIERRKNKRPRNEYAPLVHTHEVDTVISALRLSATSPGDAVENTELANVVDRFVQYGRKQLSDDELRQAIAKLAALAPAEKAGGGWTSLSENTSWLDGRDVVLLVRGMEVSARYCKGEWSDDTPISPREYSGPVWSCFDDEFQLEIEECSDDQRHWSHDGATHWRVPLALTEIDKSQHFYGAQCRSYPNCTSGCGLGCTHEMDAATPTPPSADVVKIARKALENVVANYTGRSTAEIHMRAAAQDGLATLDALIQSAAHGGGTEGGEA